MRLIFVLAALICGLQSTVSLAGEHQITLVPTVMGIRVTDRSGQALVTADSGLIVVWDQFGRHPWAEQYRDTMVIDRQPSQNVVPTRFPLDQGGIRYLWLYSKFVHRPKINIGFSVLDRHRRPVTSMNGVRIVLWQLGEDVWPQELWVTIEGELDERGHILALTKFPLTSLVVKNLTELAQRQQ